MNHTQATTSGTPTTPDPRTAPGRHRLWERLGTADTDQLLERASDSPERRSLAHTITETAEALDRITLHTLGKLSRAQDDIERLLQGGRLSPDRNGASLGTRGCEIDVLIARQEQALADLDRLIDLFRLPTTVRPPVGAARPRSRTAPCTCNCTRPCGCGHAGCTAR